MPIRYSDQEGLYWASIAAEGATTAPGAAAGTSFIDASLVGAGANSFVSMLAILYPGDPRKVDSKDIIAFTPGTGEVTLAGAYKGIVAPIPAGVPYRIVTFRFVPAEVAALAADIGDASASTLGSLYAILGNPSISLTSKINHVPKFTGDLWWVSTTGDDADDGKSPEMAFLTIAHAIATAAAGDRIKVKAGAYNEALTMNKVGLELVCEQGTILTNATPGTPLVVGPANYQRVVGAILAEAGQTGLQVTGSFCSLEDCLAFGSSIGFDDDGAENHFKNCRSILHTATGFDISAGYGQYEMCIAAGGGAAVRGVYLSNAAADHNHFFDCHTLGNATAGWEVIAGAANNLFSHCSMGAGDGAKVDANVTDTWADWAEGSQILAGQTRDQDLKDIFDRILALTTFKQETHAAVNANGTTWVDLLDKSTITKPTKICGFLVTVSAGWAGKARLRIVDGAGTTKIFPFQAYYEQDTDFTSATQAVFNFEVVVPVADGYKVQFCSSAAGDVGAGFDVTLNNLDVIEVG